MICNFGRAAPRSVFPVAPVEPVLAGQVPGQNLPAWFHRCHRPVPPRSPNDLQYHRFHLRASTSLPGSSAFECFTARIQGRSISDRKSFGFLQPASMTALSQ